MPRRAELIDGVVEEAALQQGNLQRGEVLRRRIVNVAFVLVPDPYWTTFDDEPNRTAAAAERQSAPGADVHDSGQRFQTACKIFFETNQVRVFRIKPGRQVDAKGEQVLRGE